MEFQTSAAASRCPDPQARAPRAKAAEGRCSERIRLAPLALRGALVALVERDTRHLPLTDAQRLTHFPASAVVSISWFDTPDVGTIERAGDGLRWQPFGAQVVVSGTQSRPLATWSPRTGRGCLACFTADAARTLFGIDVGRAKDRFSPVDAVTAPRWRPLWDELLADGDADPMAVLERHLAPHWRALQGALPASESLRQLGQHWVERLAWRAHQWRQLHGPRQVERRIKASSGRSLRDWQALVRTEGLFFAARDRHDAGQAFDWAALAQSEGFSDQAHMIRTAKRTTGFSPTEFASRIVEDESFWLYRLWA